MTCTLGRACANPNVSRPRRHVYRRKGATNMCAWTIRGGLLAACLAVAVAAPAQGALIQNGMITTDTESGLEWLNLAETKGLSYNQAAAAFLPAGWRFATTVEVNDVRVKAGLFPNGLYQPP